MKFTPRSIEALKPELKRYIAWKDNGNGLGVRVTPNGKRSFVFMYRFDGKPRMMTLGEFPKTKFADAGVLHTAAQKLLEEGIDPAAKKIKEKQDYKDSDTIDGLSEMFMEWAKKNKKSWEEDQRIINKDILPMLGSLKVQDVKKKDILAIIDKVVARGATVTANRTLACIRKMLNFAVERDIIEVSPCHSVKMPSKESPRDRVLTQDEIMTFWQGLDNDKVAMSKETKLALRLVLATAQRKGEILEAEWSEIDMQNRWWTIPKEKAKNGLSHRVPLSDKTIELLNELKVLTGEYKYILPNRDDKEKHLTEWVLSGAINKNFEHIGVVVKFTPHDLRRTAVSHMTSMGISRFIVKKILNHADKDVTAVYDRHSYDKEKRFALDAWGAELSRILDKEKSSNVLVMKAS